MIGEAEIEAAILRLLAAPGTRSITPEDAARALDADWRPLLGPVRRAALRLARAGRVEILHKGRPVPPEEVRGVIRLRLPPGGEAA